MRSYRAGLSTLLNFFLNMNNSITPAGRRFEWPDLTWFDEWYECEWHRIITRVVDGQCAPIIWNWQRRRNDTTHRKIAASDLSLPAGSDAAWTLCVTLATRPTQNRHASELSLSVFIASVVYLTRLDLKQCTTFHCSSNSLDFSYMGQLDVSVEAPSRFYKRMVWAE